MNAAPLAALLADAERGVRRDVPRPFEQHRAGRAVAPDGVHGDRDEPVVHDPHRAVAEQQREDVAPRGAAFW